MSKYYSLVDIDSQEEIAYQFNIDIDDNNNVVIEIALQEGQINVCLFNLDLHLALNIVNNVLAKCEAEEVIHDIGTYTIKTDIANRKIVATICGKNYCTYYLLAEILNAFSFLHMTFFSGK